MENASKLYLVQYLSKLAYKILKHATTSSNGFFMTVSGHFLRGRCGNIRIIMHDAAANPPETSSLTRDSFLLTCWLSSVRVRRVFMTSSALAASIRPPLKAETPTHATEYAKTCTGGHVQRQKKKILLQILFHYYKSFSKKWKCFWFVL